MPSDGLAAANGVDAPADTIELTVPELGDLGERAVVERWLKRVGDRVDVDEPLCRLAVGELEFEVCSTADGELTRIFAEEGVGVMETGSLAQVMLDGPPPLEEAGADAFANPAGAEPAQPPAQRIESIDVGPIDPEFAPVEPSEAEPAPAGSIASIEVEPVDPEFAPTDDAGRPGPAAAAPAVEPPAVEPPARSTAPLPTGEDVDWAAWVSPVVQMLAEEHGIDLAQVRGTGIGGRVRKRDVLAYVETRPSGGA